MYGSVSINNGDTKLLLHGIAMRIGISKTMEENLRWSYIHAYRDLVNAEKASDFECHRCQNRASVLLGKDKQIVVHCWICDTTIEPNAWWFDEIKRIVDAERINH